MKFLTKLMYTIHRVLGTLLSILFFVWFLSAFVMMYHRFPRVSEKEKLQRQELLTRTAGTLPDIADVVAHAAKDEKIRSLSLCRSLGQTVFEIKTNKGELNLPATPSDTILPISREYILRNASLWNKEPISRIDTLDALDTWIPFEKLKKELPIYKIHFNDKEKTELYMSSQSGEALQHSTHKERVWAWFSAIPHWGYFAWLRQNTALWRRTMITLTALGCLMVFAGCWVTIDVWKKNRRRSHSTFSPYKKKWYHWHYVSGIFFGLFVFTFTFSGMMSLNSVQEWNASKGEKAVSPVKKLQILSVCPEQFKLDYRQVLARYPKTKEIKWSCFGNHPYYTLKEDKKEWYIDAADPTMKPLDLTEEDVCAAIHKAYGKDSVFQLSAMEISSLNHFETYYRDMNAMYRGQSQLPVWKVEMNDAGNRVFYIHPQTAKVRYVDTVVRWKYWTYTALHRMRLPGLNSNGTLRKGILWMLLLGGTMVSASGVMLSVNYIRKKYRKLKK